MRPAFLQLPSLLSALTVSRKRRQLFSRSDSYQPSQMLASERRRPGFWQRWRTRHQLAKLDARQLADIGLTPAQAYRESQRPFWR